MIHWQAWKLLPAQLNTIQLELLPKWPVKIQNTRWSQMFEVLWTKRERKRETSGGGSLTLGLKTILIYCSNDAFKGRQWDKMNFFFFFSPPYIEGLSNHSSLKIFPGSKITFFFHFNEKLNVILIIYKILFYFFFILFVQLFHCRL